MRFQFTIRLGKVLLMICRSEGRWISTGLFIERRHFSRGKGGDSFPRKGPLSSWLQWDRIL